MISDHDDNRSLLEIATTARRERARASGIFSLAAYHLQKAVLDRLTSERVSAESSRLPWRARRLLALLPELSFTICPGVSSHLVGERPRALLMSHDFSGSGAPRLLVEIADVMVRWGWEVMVASPAPGPMKRLLRGVGASSIAGPILFSNHALLEALARRSTVAILNTTEMLSLAPILAVHTRCFSYLHEISLLQRRLADPKGSTAADLRAAAGVWAGNEVTANLARSVGIKADVFPYGLDRSWRPTPALKSEKRVVIGVFGSYEARKGQDLIADALQRLGAPANQIEIRMYGRTLEKAFMKSLREAIKAWPQVSIHGELSQEAYLSAMNACDMVLIPSRDDTLPLVSLDALGFSKVLVCTATTGTAVYLVDGVSGFVAEQPTAASIAAALSRVLSGRDRLHEIATAGRKVFEANFSKAAFASSLWRRLAVEGPGPA